MKTKKPLHDRVSMLPIDVLPLACLMVIAGLLLTACVPPPGATTSGVSPVVGGSSTSGPAHDKPIASTMVSPTMQTPSQMPDPNVTTTASEAPPTPTVVTTAAGRTDATSPSPGSTARAGATVTATAQTQLPLVRQAGPTASRGDTGLPVFSHVFVIIMENKEAPQVVGNPSAPYLNKLAGQYARATNYFAVSHPSLPNYLALAGGDTFGIKHDCTDCYVNSDNLASQLSQAGRSWKAYMESMPQPCFTGPATESGYAQKHNPFIYFDNIRNNPALCAQIVPLPQLDADLQANNLPDFVWITPNLCSDMHDCGVKTGDDWLQTWVSKIQASPAWQDNGVLFITFDEGTTTEGCCQYASGGKVDTLVISPLARPGFVSTVDYNHYSLLRTIEESWGLPPLGKAGCDCTPAMQDFFTPP